VCVCDVAVQSVFASSSVSLRKKERKKKPPLDSIMYGIVLDG